MSGRLPLPLAADARTMLFYSATPCCWLPSIGGARGRHARSPRRTVPGPPSPRAGMFKTLVGKEIAVELKNDVALTGALSASLDMT